MTVPVVRNGGAQYSGIAHWLEEEALLKSALLVSGLVLLGVVVVACKGSDAATNGGGVIITPIAALTQTVPPSGSGSSTVPLTTTAPGTPVPTPNPLIGFTYPIAGSCLPKGDQLMPNAPRPYRNGIHEGVDFYQVDNCAGITRGTEVLAAKPGRVVRADLDYRDITAAEVAAYMANPNTEEALDQFRGRQVWIQHDRGVVTRYVHLSGIAPGITVGATVARGQVVGYVGESGTPESVSNPGAEYHLHFEVRIGEGYLGAGLPPAEVRRLYLQFFAP